MRLYSVYTKDDVPLIIGGTARECAKIMGVSEESFRTLCSKQTTGKLKPGKYQIYIDEDIPDEELYEQEETDTKC